MYCPLEKITVKGTRCRVSECIWNIQGKCHQHLTEATDFPIEKLAVLHGMSKRKVKRKTVEGEGNIKAAVILYQYLLYFIRRNASLAVYLKPKELRWLQSIQKRTPWTHVSLVYNVTPGTLLGAVDKPHWEAYTKHYGLDSSLSYLGVSDKEILKVYKLKKRLKRRLANEHKHS